VGCFKVADHMIATVCKEHLLQRTFRELPLFGSD